MKRTWGGGQHHIIQHSLSKLLQHSFHKRTRACKKTQHITRTTQVQTPSRCLPVMSLPYFVLGLGLALHQHLNQCHYPQLTKQYHRSTISGSGLLWWPLVILLSTSQSRVEYGGVILVECLLAPILYEGIYDNLLVNFFHAATTQSQIFAYGAGFIFSLAHGPS